MAILPIFCATFATVFVAEIVGDKLLYTTGVLAERYRAAPILSGMALAFMVKMGAAVLAGSAVSRLPALLVATVTAINFFAVALILWRKPDRTKGLREHAPSHAALVSFAAILFSEWGDVGQLTTAAMAARYGAPAVVWLGAVSAMITKGAGAASIGAGARCWIQQHLAPKTIRYAAVSMLLFLGLLSVLETLGEARAS